MKRKLSTIFFAILLFAVGFAYANDVVGSDGCVNQDEFKTSWEKYSDFQSSEPEQSKSIYVQQYHQKEQEVKLAKEKLLTMGNASAQDKKDVEDQIAAAEHTMQDLLHNEAARVYAELNKNCRKGMAPGLAVHGPTRVAVGEKATYTFTVLGQYTGYGIRLVDDQGVVDIRPGASFWFVDNKPGKHEFTAAVHNLATDENIDQMTFTVDVVDPKDLPPDSRFQLEGPQDVKSGSPVTFKIIQRSGSGKFDFSWRLTNEYRVVVVQSGGDTLETSLLDRLGLYSLSVDVRDEQGNLVAFFDRVRDVVPSKNFSVSGPSRLAAGEASEFTIRNTSGKTGYHYHWLTGISSSQEGDNVKLSFTKPGQHQVVVRVYHDDGSLADKAFVDVDVFPGMKLSVKIPPRMVRGEIAAVTAVPEGGPKNYHYRWFNQDGSEIAGQQSSTLRYQPKKAGTDALTVMVYDETNQDFLGKTAVSFNVAEPTENGNTLSGSSGNIHLMMNDVKLKSDTIIPGDLLGADVTFQASGILNASKDPHSLAMAHVTCDYFGGANHVTETHQAMVPNGQTTMSCSTITNKWAPGTYILAATVDISGARAVIRKNFFVRQPDVQASQPAPPPPPLEIKITDLKVAPESAAVGKVVQATVYYNASGVQGKQPALIRFTFSGQGRNETKEVHANIQNGKFWAYWRMATGGWQAGDYTVYVDVNVGGKSADADQGFALEEPEAPPAAANPPPSQETSNENNPSANTGATNVDNYLGDWEGSGTVAESNMVGLNAGDTKRVRIRITYEEDAYHVYDLDDTENTVAPPLSSRVENGQLVFYYSGPVIDEQGYRHEDMHEEITWTLTSDGNTMRGRGYNQIGTVRWVMDIATNRVR